LSKASARTMPGWSYGTCLTSTVAAFPPCARCWPWPRPWAAWAIGNGPIWRSSFVRDDRSQQTAAPRYDDVTARAYLGLTVI